VAKFECGLLTAADVLTNCNIFQGATTSTLGSSGVIALPQITWMKGFTHSSMYADDKLLDFVVSFYVGSVTLAGAKPPAYNLVT